jgi:hypothetical protein
VLCSGRVWRMADSGGMSGGCLAIEGPVGLGMNHAWTWGWRVMRGLELRFY